MKPEVIENRLAYWRKGLRGSVTQARAVMQRLIVGRITFTLRRNEVSDEIDGYDFEAITRFDNLFTGIAVERPRNFDPTDRAGLDDIRPEDTLEAEYSRILERAYNGRNQPKGASSNPAVISLSGYGGVPKGLRGSVEATDSGRRLAGQGRRRSCRVRKR